MARWIRGGGPRAITRLFATLFTTSARAEETAHRVASAPAARSTPSAFWGKTGDVWGGRPPLRSIRVVCLETGARLRAASRDIRIGYRVEGALFRRDGDLPGLPFQVGTDAAAALAMRAGKRARLEITSPVARKTVIHGTGPVAYS